MRPEVLPSRRSWARSGQDNRLGFENVRTAQAAENEWRDGRGPYLLLRKARLVLLSIHARSVRPGLRRRPSLERRPAERLRYTVGRE